MSELKFKELGDKRKIIVCKLFGIYIISKFCLLFIVAFDCGLTHGCNMNEYDIYYIFLGINPFNVFHNICMIGFLPLIYLDLIAYKEPDPNNGRILTSLSEIQNSVIGKIIKWESHSYIQYEKNGIKYYSRITDNYPFFS